MAPPKILNHPVSVPLMSASPAGFAFASGATYAEPFPHTFKVEVDASACTGGTPTVGQVEIAVDQIG